MCGAAGGGGGGGSKGWKRQLGGTPLSYGTGGKGSWGGERERERERVCVSDI